MNKNLFNLEGKVIVVTGGLGQLGRQFVKAIQEQGGRAVVFDTALNTKEVAENYLSLVVDITKRSSIEAGLESIMQKWGPPHGLINCAALDSPPGSPAEENGPFETYPAESWDKVMEVNVKGVFQCCQVIGGAMAVKGRGSIVNISSIYGLVSPDQRIYEYRNSSGKPFFKPVAYSASKSALFNLTRYLATYWADKNVRVNSVTLAGVFNSQDKQFLQEYCTKVPLGRMAREEEYNGGMIFLLSDASSYVTGSNLVMDGGFTAW